MNTYEFPRCCTAAVLADFGESNTAEGGSFKINYDKIEEYITKKLQSMFYQDYAVFTIITNNEQKTANKVLIDMKFSHSKWLKKRAHPHTKIRIWWISIDDYKTGKLLK